MMNDDERTGDEEPERKRVDVFLTNDTIGEEMGARGGRILNWLDDQLDLGDEDWKKVTRAVSQALIDGMQVAVIEIAAQLIKQGVETYPDFQISSAIEDWDDDEGGRGAD
jgi:hypothetical protein